MSKKLVNSVFTFLIGSVFATGAFAQEEAAPAPKTPTSQAAQDKDAKAKLLERKRATQASKAAKAKAKAQEKQRAAKADAAAKAAAEARALDLNRAKRTNQEAKRVNVDFPSWMVESLDREAQHLGVTRQSVIKMWIAERLEKKAS